MSITSSYQRIYKLQNNCTLDDSFIRLFSVKHEGPVTNTLQHYILADLFHLCKNKLAVNQSFNHQFIGSIS